MNSTRKITDDGQVLEVFYQDGTTGRGPGWYYHFREQGAPPDHTLGPYETEADAGRAAEQDEHDWQWRQQGDDTADRHWSTHIGTTFRVLRDVEPASAHSLASPIPRGSLITFKGSEPISGDQSGEHVYHFEFKRRAGDTVAVSFVDADGPLGQWVEAVPRWKLEAENKAGRKPKP